MRVMTETLTDAMTGVPLPIYPNPELPPVVPWNEDNEERIADEHHPFHPRREVLSLGLAGEALRHCRVQWVLYGDHHEENPRGYHRFYRGPKLPQTEEAIYKTVVFAAAGLVPYKALSFDREGAPATRTLRRPEHERLLEEGVIRVGDYGKVKTYLLDYAVKHALSKEARDENLIEQFLASKDRERKLEMGRSLIRAASLVSTEPFSAEYREVKKAQLLPRRRAGVVSNFVCNLLTIKTDTSGEPDFETIAALGKLLAPA